MCESQACKILHITFLDQHLPSFQQPFRYVAAVSVFLAPFPQLLGVNIRLFCETELARIQLERSRGARQGPRRQATVPSHTCQTWSCHINESTLTIPDVKNHSRIHNQAYLWITWVALQVTSVSGLVFAWIVLFLPKRL